MVSKDWLASADSAEFSIDNIIDGKVIPALAAKVSGHATIEKFSPRDGSFLYEFPEGNLDTVNQAVSSAREAFNDGRWSGLSLAKRAAILNKLADLVEENRETFALYDCLEVGEPISKVSSASLGNLLARIRGAAKLGTEMQTIASSDQGGLSYQRFKPLGVIAACSGWNRPCSMTAGKMGPALIMGNSLILKPSELTPLSTAYLAELALEAGVPPGVFNVVQGAGHTVGAALAEHPDIDMIAFVGSSQTGKQVMAAAGQSNMKRVLLECGGKSPFMVFDDCPDDYDWLAQQIVNSAFQNQGAICVAGTRLVIQDSMRDSLIPLVVQKAKALIPGDPLDPKTNFGALINEAHLNKVMGYIQSGLDEGAELILGGERFYPNGQDGDLSSGYYLPPTIFDRVDPNAKIAQEEIFGPVLCIQTFKTEDEAIELANNTSFGLAAYAATTDLNRAQRLCAKINTGSLAIIATSTPSGSPAGLGSTKYGESGIGYSGGFAGLQAYCTTTTCSISS